MAKYNLKEAIELYKTVGSRNADFLFNWLYNIYSQLYLPSIDERYKDALALDKTKLTIFDVLVDDLADHYKIRNWELLEEAIKMPWSPRHRYESNYLNVTREIWDDCIASISTYPRFKEFEKIFYFDLAQVLQSMRYSYLANTTQITNSDEDKDYLPHGVMFVLHCDMDLMCSPTFDTQELGKLRIFFRCAQDIAHIGNMINTFPREVLERDFSSPIISLAIRLGLLTQEDLINNPKAAKDLLQKLLPFYKKRVEKRLYRMTRLKNEIKSIKLDAFLQRSEQAFEAFLKRPPYWELGAKAVT